MVRAVPFLIWIFKNQGQAEHSCALVVGLKQKIRLEKSMRIFLLSIKQFSIYRLGNPCPRSAISTVYSLVYTRSIPRGAADKSNSWFRSIVFHNLE